MDIIIWYSQWYLILTMVFDTHNSILNHASQMLHIRMQLTDVAINPMETWNLYILQPFLKDPLQNYKKILEKCFLGAIWTVMLSTGRIIQSHTAVLPVAKGLTFVLLHITKCHSEKKKE